MRAEPCACGDTIRADPANPTPWVARHNRSRRHLEWRGMRYHRCEGVGCMTELPADRPLCRWCVGTARLLARLREA